MSRPSRTRPKSTSFAVDSCAPTLAPPAKAPDSGRIRAADIRLSTSSASSTRRALDSSSSRTSPRAPSAGFLAWCKSCGIEVIDPGPFLSAPSTSGHPTDGSASSLWPTATVQHRAGSARYGTESGRKSGTTLTDAVKGLFPTPSAVSYGSNRGGAVGRVGPIRQSLQTPQSRDERGPTGTEGRLGSGGRRSSLSDATMPRATAGRLNPQWVATLMGFPSTWLDTLSPLAEEPSSTCGKRPGRSLAT